MNIAIIPARAGSKRITGKNIKSFCGKPIISYSIETAKKSKIFDKIIVSTDSKEIADISKYYGAEVPFLRPKSISDDFSTISDVMLHATKYLKNEYEETIQTVCCIFPTAPLLKVEDLLKGYNIFNEGRWTFVFAATNFSYPIQRSFKKNISGSITMFYPEYYNSRSQDLEKGYHDAGLFYFGSTKSWIKKSNIFSENCSIILIPKTRVQDIDEPEDWLIAEKKFISFKR